MAAWPRGALLGPWRGWAPPARRAGCRSRHTARAPGSMQEPPRRRARAAELFDWLRQLPETHELAHLCDVYTYTTAISHVRAPDTAAPLYQQAVRMADGECNVLGQPVAKCSPLAWRGVSLAQLKMAGACVAERALPLTQTLRRRAVRVAPAAAQGAGDDRGDAQPRHPAQRAHLLRAHERLHQGAAPARAGARVSAQRGTPVNGHALERRASVPHGHVLLQANRLGG
jgi:hypothetical protein